MMNKSEQEIYQRAIQTGNKLQKKNESMHTLLIEYLAYLNVLSSIDKVTSISIDKVKEMLTNINNAC